jgi:transcriptional regulator with XRE-family HTH domain
MTIGSELRQAREQRGVSLHDISRRTNIRVPVLRAVEHDDFQRVPGHVVMRGFLKLYAREVGLDPEDIGRRFMAQLESAGTSTPDRDAGADGGSPAVAGSPREGASPRATTGVVAAIVVLIVLAGGYPVWRSTNDAAAPADRAVVKEPVAAPDTGGAPAASPAAVRPVDPPPAARDTSGGGLVVEVQATAASWLAATADGRQVVYRVLNPGERVDLRITREAVLRIGMPGNVLVTINGSAVRPFARPATPTTLRIAPANYRELIEQQDPGPGAPPAGPARQAVAPVSSS